MNRFFLRLSAFVLTLCLAVPAFAFPAEAAPATPRSTRIGGIDRIHTACLTAEEGWNRSEYALLANAYSFPDALAGVPLAGALDAPVLLTGNGKQPEPAVLDQLERMETGVVYILGGTSAVSASLENFLTERGMTVKRLAGKDRFATAAAIAAELEQLKGTPEQVFFASAANYPDALAAGPTAAALGSPILYIKPDGTLDNTTSEYLYRLADSGSVEAVILGGSSAVASGAEKNLSRSGAESIRRIQGSDRYKTAIAISTAYPSLLAGGDMVAATGTAFPDALAGGALAARLGSPIALLPKVAGSSDILRFVGKNSPNRVYILGGQSAVADDVADSYFGHELPEVFADEEMRAVWIPYLCQEGIDRAAIDRMICDCVELGCNTVIFHARPFGDAVYDSDIFPWSHVITGTQGQAPADGFDPLAYAVEQAHARGMELHAWINPLRIQLAGGSRPSALSEDNPYTVWRTDSNPANDVWVVDYNSGKFYNPAYPQVRQLLVDGMVELVRNYSIDGIHWDDYFYPAADESFDDSLMYTAYTEAGGTMTLLQWRTDNINTLIRSSYAAVKAIDPDCSFGISPQGNFGNCLRIGADVYEWCSSPGYIDYICPQVYWSFDNTIAPFEPRCRQWRDIVTQPGIDLYIGLALYKAAGTADGGKWQKSDRDIADQIECLRGEDIRAEGFMLYSYQYLDMPGWEGEVSAVRELLCDN